MLKSQQLLKTHPLLTLKEIKQKSNRSGWDHEPHYIFGIGFFISCLVAFASTTGFFVGTILSLILAWYRYQIYYNSTFNRLKDQNKGRQKMHNEALENERIERDRKKIEQEKWNAAAPEREAAEKLKLEQQANQKRLEEEKYKQQRIHKSQLEQRLLNKLDFDLM